MREPELIGRDSELSALREMLDQARAGHGALAVIEGESGGGKTMLLNALAAGCIDERVWLLRGEGRHLGAEKPYEVLDGVIAGIARRSETDEAFAGRMRAALGEETAELTAAMLQLSGLFAGIGAELGGSVAVHRQRTLQVLTSMLDVLGSAARPALVLLDDCQWADEATLELLREWQDAAARTDIRHVLILAAFRADDPAVVRQLGDAPVKRLRPAALDRSDIEQVVTSMAGAVPPAAADLVVQLSEGSPFLATEVLRGLVEKELLIGDGEGWQIQANRMNEAQSSTRAAAVVAERLGQLAEPVLEILSARRGSRRGHQLERSLFERDVLEGALHLIRPRGVAAPVDELFGDRVERGPLASWAVAGGVAPGPRPRELSPNRVP